ncbi:hypothetical protein Bbelb_417270 [Branchiostoma belcheri]|nr:hypothetical protein Bbelb_417270 [Branchiostoma belcheri]
MQNFPGEHAPGPPTLLAPLALDSCLLRPVPLFKHLWAASGTKAGVEQRFPKHFPAQRCELEVGETENPKYFPEKRVDSTVMEAWKAFRAEQGGTSCQDSEKKKKLERFLKLLLVQAEKQELYFLNDQEQSWDSGTVCNVLAQEFLSDVHECCSAEDGEKTLVSYLLSGNGCLLVQALNILPLQAVDRQTSPLDLVPTAGFVSSFSKTGRLHGGWIGPSRLVVVLVEC